MKINIYALLGLLLAMSAAFSQDHHAHHDMGGADSSQHHAEHHTMSSVFFADHPMGRDGSGTSWHPDASPVSGHHFHRNGWDMMVHGSVFARVTAQDVNDAGERGETEISFPNWIMAAAQRRISPRQQFMVRTMLTLEPLTEGGSGYPLLFQTGEALDGELLIDRQHPHDLLAEVGVGYTINFNDSAGMQLYAAYPGEPAIGPPAFMHRPSARHNPNPPLAHHWQDATHITYGVVTLGLRHQNLKFDASLFTGREPNDERFIPDKPKMDSWSIRLIANVPDKLSFQISRAFLNDPEELFPGSDIRRTTASILYHHPLTKSTSLSAAFIWGLNEPVEEEVIDTGSLGKAAGPADIEHVPPGSNLHSFLLETDFEFGKQAIYSRAEWVEKSSVDLGVILLNDEELAIGSWTLGFSRKLFSTLNWSVALGGQGTMYRIPDELKSIYGSGPLSAEAFLHFTP